VDRSISGASSAISSIQVATGNPRYLSAIVSGSQAVNTSQDGGSTWVTTLSENHQDFVALADSKTSPGVFFGLDAASRVYRKAGVGASWTSWSFFSDMTGPASDLDTGNVAGSMVAATGASGSDRSPSYSVDAGSSWYPGDCPVDVWSVAVGDPTGYNKFYVSRQAVTATPLARSTDGGVSWIDCGTFPAAVHVTGLAVFPYNGPVLAGSDTAGVDAIYRSNDGGTTWTASAAGLPPGEQVLSLTISSSPSVAYAATSTGVYASYDSGTTWSDISNNLPEKVYCSVSASGGSTNAIYLGSQDGNIYEASAPVITGISPDSGNAGDTVTINGSSFGAAGATSYVAFAGLRADSYASWTDTRISVKVPTHAMTGDLYVVTPRGTSNAAEFTIDTPTPPSHTWYLAEGCTGHDWRGGFETWVLVQNPGDTVADVDVTFMTDEGPQDGLTLNVPAHSRQSLNVADFVPDTWSVSTSLSSNRPVFAERSVYWNAKGCYRQAATGSIGVTAPARGWYLAEGCTGVSSNASFETWVLVQNPGSKDTEVNLTYMTSDGAVPGPSFSLPAYSRKSVDVSESVPNCWSVSTSVTSGLPVVAERSMYLNTASTYRQAATDSIGSRTGATTWYLAEGCTGVNGDGAFETWVLVQNPGLQTANVQLTYMTPDGPVTGPTLALAPLSRQSVSVAGAAPREWDVSTKVTSDQPVIAERAIYWSTTRSPRQSATDSIGVTTPATSWCLAEGSTGGSDQGAFETWVLIQNPGSTAATIHITYMTSQGQVSGPTFTVEPDTRHTVNVAEVLPNEWDVSTRVTSDQPVIVERSMYWDAPGVMRQAAADSIGAAQ